jgi:hypothetical protein
MLESDAGGADSAAGADDSSVVLQAPSASAPVTVSARNMVRMVVFIEVLPSSCGAVASLPVAVTPEPQGMSLPLPG